MNGTSPRANRQVKLWNKQAGSNEFSAKAVKTNIPGRKTALEWEKQNAQRLKKQGNQMYKHLRP